MRYPPVYYLMIPVTPLQTATNLLMTWIFTQLPAEFQCRCNAAAMSLQLSAAPWVVSLLDLC